MISSIWQIELFGSLRLTRADRVITRFRTQKTAALLAYLALHIERAHPREALITLLWPDEPIEAGRNGLRVALNSLRKQLEPLGTPYGGVLFADRNQVQLNPDACTTDIARFMSLVQSDHLQTGAPTLEEIKEAVALYRGDLLPGFYDDWVGLERERLSQIYNRSILTLARAFSDRNDFDLAADYANRAVQVDPFSEEPYRILMLAHGRQGNIAAARQWYERLTSILKTELGTSPNRESTELIADIVARTGDGTVIARSAPTLAASGASALTPRAKVEVLGAGLPGDGLPYPFTAFFSRDMERSQIRGLTDPTDPNSARILTLTGPGGIGKTRLAVESARDMRDVFEESIIFVPLSEETSTSRIVEAVALAAGLPRSVSGDYWDALVSRLEERQTLLILDGFEHLTAEGGSVVLALQKAAPVTRTLVTSRRRLGIPGERELAIPPLAVPQSFEMPEQLNASPSVLLFVDRAQSVASDFAITSRNRDDLAAVCRALEGIPLALELAATHTRSVTLREMRERLTEPTTTANRFHLLTSRRADKPGRHRSLWAAIAWSFELLPPPLRSFFTTLSVFSGGWTLEAAQFVCQEPYAREYLTQLRSHSLIQSDEQAFPEQRFRMLDSLREFAREQILPDEQLNSSGRHLEYFLGLADEARQRLRGSDQKSWLKRIDADHDNFRAAIRWCAANNECAGELGLRLAGNLGHYWQLHGPLRESAKLVTELLDETQQLGSSPHRAGALNTVGGLSLRLGDYDSARKLFDEGIAIYRKHGDRAGTARMLMNQGYLNWAEGDLQASVAARRESLEIFLDLGDRWQAAACHLNLGCVQRDMGDRIAAAASFEASLAISREIGDARGSGSAILNLANIAYAEGDTKRARALYEESLLITRDQENSQGIALALSNLGALLLDQNSLDEAEVHFLEALQIGRSTGDASLTGAFLIELGRIASRRGDFSKAHAYLTESTTLNLIHVKACVALEGFAEVATNLESMDTAAVLYGAAAALRASGESPLQPDQHSGQNIAIDAIRRALGAEVFDKKWIVGMSMTRTEAFAFASRLPVITQKRSQASRR